jgi:hypothetical protein
MTAKREGDGGDVAIEDGLEAIVTGASGAEGPGNSSTLKETTSA